MEASAAGSNKYVDEAMLRLNSDNSLSLMEKEGNTAVLLMSVGKFQESIIHFEKSLQELRSLKSEFVWKDYFASVCTSYAIALDYLNEPDKAEALYKELFALNPNGSMLYTITKYFVICANVINRLYW